MKIWLTSAIVLLLSSTLVGKAAAQMIDFTEPLVGQLPKGVASPTDQKQCDALTADWNDIKYQIGREHTKCLVSTDKNPKAQHGEQCIYAACENLHRLMSSPELKELQENQESACGQTVAKWQAKGSNAERPGQGFGTQRPRVTPNPDQVALQELKKGATDAALAKLIDVLIATRYVPAGTILVVLKNAAAAYNTQVGQNAIRHIRAVYGDDQRKILYLGAPYSREINPIAGFWNRQRPFVEQASDFLKPTGGTIWSVDFPAGNGSFKTGLFYHPNPNFKVKRHRSVYAMYAPGRPDQNVGPRLYPDHRGAAAGGEEVGRYDNDDRIQRAERNYSLCVNNYGASGCGGLHRQLERARGR